MDIGRMLLYATTPFVYAKMFVKGKWKPNIHPYRTVKELRSEIDTYKMRISVFLSTEVSGLPLFKGDECFECPYCCYITMGRYAFSYGCGKDKTPEELHDAFDRVCDVLKISNQRWTPEHPTRPEVFDSPDLLEVLADKIRQRMKERKCTQYTSSPRAHQEQGSQDVPQPASGSSNSECTGSGRCG